MRAGLAVAAALVGSALLAACADDVAQRGAYAGVSRAGQTACARDPGKNPVTDCPAAPSYDDYQRSRQAADKH